MQKKTIAGGQDERVKHDDHLTGDVLGATNNLQGRHSNGVNPGDVCDTEAVAAPQRFLHIEQDPDVREEPLHVIEALRTALDTLTGGSAVGEWWEVE